MIQWEVKFETAVIQVCFGFAVLSESYCKLTFDKSGLVDGQFVMLCRACTLDNLCKLVQYTGLLLCMGLACIESGNVLIESPVICISNSNGGS